MKDVTKPTPPAPASATRAGGGLKSTLKILLPVVVFMAVIFGVTFFSQYTPPDEEKPVNNQQGDKDPPLRFATSTRHWDAPDFFSNLGQPFRGFPLMAPSATPVDPEFPFKYDIQNRVFPGFYEVQSDAVGPKHSASFWFENPHGQSVTMRLQSVSCSACSGGRVAPIPPEVTRQLLQMSGVSILPQGLTTGIPVGMVGPAANLRPDLLKWQQHTFRDDPHPDYKIPAADNKDGWSPQWAILELQFSVGALIQKVLEADFATVVDGTSNSSMYKIIIAYEGVNAFDLTGTVFDVGEVSENSEPRKFEIIAYSSTRGPNRTGAGELGDLSAPIVSVRMPTTLGGDPGKFLEVGTPIRVSESELPFVARLLSDKSKKAVRIESAYRYPVTLRPKVGASRIDIGTMERDIWFAVNGTQERQVRVKGMVRGAVWLDNNNTEIDLGAYASSEGYGKAVTIITAQPDLEVGLVSEECMPKFLQLKFEKDPNPPSRDRGYYKLAIRAPGKSESKNLQYGTWNGEIVLQVKGPNPQRIRIPVKGRVDLR